VIARLSGRLADKKTDCVILDVAGVGYEVHVPLSTFLELPDAGKTVQLHIHTHVREEALSLYGFRSEGERIGFRLLIGISGVGPRLALGILSGIPLPRLIAAIRDGDKAALRGIPGVGPKSADRILVELRDKLDRFPALEAGEPATDIEKATVSALENLGYPRAQAEKVVRMALEQLPTGSTLEDLVREALRVAAR
jgi:Holliday junction DNA helicase RuvA